MRIDTQTIPDDNDLNRETHSSGANVQDTQHTFSNNSLASLETIDKHVADAVSHHLIPNGFN